jgi:acyl-[acyl carrier protein]--UDP-N-acetylglucosamine O-acyltransferase
LTQAVIPALQQMTAFLRWRALTRTYRSSRNTTIGNDVWIGFRSTVLGGALIGDGAVVAAGSVVFSDVPPFAVVAGNPAQVLRYRFSRKFIERMQRIAWWKWPDEQVRENLEWFYKPIAEFVERFDAGASALG